MDEVKHAESMVRRSPRMRRCSPDSIQRSGPGRCRDRGPGQRRSAGRLAENCFKAIDKPGIDGALVIRGEEMAVWGELPTIRRARVGAERITKG